MEELVQTLAGYGPHVTGGSDFHGEKGKLDIQLAALEMELSWLFQ